MIYRVTKLIIYGKTYLVVAFVRIFHVIVSILFETRTKTSIRYAKENDREKRERRKERERKVK